MCDLLWSDPDDQRTGFFVIKFLIKKKKMVGDCRQEELGGLGDLIFLKNISTKISSK